MGLLLEAYQELLGESVDISKVNDAINNTYEVMINYKSKGQNKHTGLRLIQPVAYGLTKAGFPVIRAYQPFGDTTTKSPSWKFFRLDRITSWQPIKAKVFMAPPGTKQELAMGKFNTNGDKTMSTVLNIAKFKQVARPSVRRNGNKQEPTNLNSQNHLNEIKQKLQNTNFVKEILQKVKEN